MGAGCNESSSGRIAASIDKGETNVENYLVSFYKDGSDEPVHQVLVKAENDLSVIRTATDHFVSKNVSPDELASHTVISHDQGTIDDIELV